MAVLVLFFIPLLNAMGSLGFVDAAAGSFLQSRETRWWWSSASRAGSVHWVFVTDCSAYMFNQGNLLLASANAVGQEGAFTWIMYGCERDEQKKAMQMLAHPNASVWFAPTVNLTDPETGEQFAHFQASNRPVSLQAWHQATQPKEEAIAIIDPDMLFMRAVTFSEDPRNGPHGLNSGPWQTLAAAPKHGVGARYSQGCISNRWGLTEMQQICGDRSQLCLEASHDYTACDKAYSSGPPWIMHKSDAGDLLNHFPVTTLRVHQVWPDLLSEQVAYGVTQMRGGIHSTIDPFWFVSSPGADDQPWDAVAELDWDPCKERSAPPKNASNPIFFHACSTFHIQHLGWALHKDHIHKDLLDCDAPLLRYPPRDALFQYKHKRDPEFRDTWSVCTYTNLVNAYAGAWKKKFCKAPNLEATFEYPPYASSFLNEKSWLVEVFRSGGWSDNDYSENIRKAK